MNKIVLTVLKEYFEHTTGDVTLEQIEICAQAISDALEPQQSVQLTCATCGTSLDKSILTGHYYCPNGNCGANR